MVGETFSVDIEISSINSKPKIFDFNDNVIGVNKIDIVEITFANINLGEASSTFTLMLENMIYSVAFKFTNIVYVCSCIHTQYISSYIYICVCMYTITNAHCTLQQNITLLPIRSTPSTVVQINI